MKNFFILLSVLAISCSESQGQLPDVPILTLDGGAGGSDGSGECPEFTPSGCTRCTDALNDLSKVDLLCQNFDGIPGGIPSEWIYESLMVCVCSGVCASFCSSSCSVDPKTQYRLDQSIISPLCDICIQTVPKSQQDMPGCGEMLQLCNLDFTP